MKKIVSLLLVLAMMATLAVTVCAESFTTEIVVYMGAHEGNGWADRARIVALPVPLSEVDDDSDILGVFTLTEGDMGSQSIRVGAYQTVYFYWLYDNEGATNYDAYFTIARGERTLYVHNDSGNECSLENDELLCISEVVEERATTITYNVNPSFTVTIPENVTINGETATVSAEDVVVNKGKYVSVSLAEENSFTVTTAEYANLPYTVTVNGNAIEAGAEILAVNPKDGKSGSASIAFAIDETKVIYSGTYKGTATFTIEVKDVPISFNIDDTTYTADYGMTWGQWLTSEYNVGGRWQYDEWGAIYDALTYDDDEFLVLAYVGEEGNILGNVMLEDVIRTDFIYSALPPFLEEC